MKKSIGEISIKESKDLCKLEKYIEEVLDYHNIPDEYFGNIMLAISQSSELILKKRQARKPLKINVQQTNKGLSFEIRNEGSGKDHAMDELDLAIERQNILRETFIIRSLADATELKDGGDTVVLNFSVTGINYERSLKRMDQLKNYLSTREKVIDTNES